MKIRLTVTAGPHSGASFEFDRHDTFVVGRSPEAHFSLPGTDRYFSRTHFLVEINPPRCRLFDLGSRNGTFVNDCRVKTADLWHGDVIGGGKTKIAVTIEREKPRAVVVDESGRYSVDAGHFVPVRTAGEKPKLQPPGYRDLEPIASGGMGVVYKAIRAADRETVAIKSILPQVEFGAEEVARFLREARILRQLDHPHIVRFHEMGEAGGQLFFVMDYVPGGNAEELLRSHRGPLPVKRAVGMICQALEALEYAHTAGFVHCDVKPANLLVTAEQGRDFVRLADFGLALVYGSSSMSGLSMTDQRAGTIPFMAPEQITNFRNINPAADQYAIAATLYRLLTKRYVYDFPRSASNRLGMILNEDPVPIRERRAEIPQELAGVIQRALSRTPIERFADVREMRAALVPFTGRNKSVK